ncbi:MAG: UbiA family prenyltransferase [Flavobacteriales bacterium]|nr:UbiA family prenyltransferase [Flavobacteriales bacterium]
MITLNNYLSLIKFSHTVFALPFALIGFFLASNQFGFSWGSLALVIMSMVFARSAAMAFNRYIDRDIDLKNPRTAQVREIPKGIISPNAALLFVILTSVNFIITTYFINTLCFYLSPIALVVVLGYSYTKRFTSLCHLVLGLGLALAPLGAYLAVSGEFALSPILFSIAVLFWVSGFDIIYALQDDNFDKENKLNSIPVFLGRNKAINLSKFFHLITFSTLAYAGVLLEGSILYWIGFSLFSFLLFYQHTIISENDLSRVNLAFFTTNGIASVVFGVFVILDVIL